jgi:hypothetical protein
LLLGTGGSPDMYLNYERFLLNIFGGLKLQSKNIPKLDKLDIGGYSKTSQKTDFFTINAVKTSNLAARRRIMQQSYV